MALQPLQSSEAVPTEPLDEYRRVWRAKRTLRIVYADCFRRIHAACVPGRTLEIGGGALERGDLEATKAPRPLIVSDVQVAPWLDCALDAHVLPFDDGSFSNIIMMDVLHHLGRPCVFLEEARRVLAPGGRVVMVEPGITPLSRIFYDRFHPEPVDMSADVFADVDLSASDDPYDSNQAIPTLMFDRNSERVEATTGLRVIGLDHFSLLAYPLSGGFRPWTVLPAVVAPAMLRVERLFEKWLGRLIGFRLLAVLEKPVG